MIKILSENLVNQIAAGEVVERPASAVKEIVENSIDAGADSIFVEVKDAGKTFIKISDNGHGMSSEDLRLSLQRHATSKISDESDLWKIKTMGFRGEALASISSVSKLSIRSKRANDLSGVEIECNGGEIVTVKDVGMSNGTVIEVHNLFFNTPARQKYLKKDSTELANITYMLSTIALANFGISFKFVHNGKVLFDLPKVTDLISRIGDVFGKATSEAMLAVFYGGSSFKIDGFIGKPLLSRSTGKHQYFFVNGRPIQDFLLANTIKSAFHSMLMENKKPVFVININIDPSLVDVNVHPRKLEVRFEDQQSIIKAVYGCVKVALDKGNLIPKAFTESRRYMSDKFPTHGEKLDFSFERLPNNLPLRRSDSKGSAQDSLDFSKNMMGTNDPMHAVSQFSNSYIVAKKNDELILIDQHAAHERVRYEQLMDQLENQEKSIQPLLVPLQMEFSSEEKNLIEENTDIFVDLGFEIEHFGGNTFVINAVPGFFVNEDIVQVLNGLLDDLINEKTPSKLQGNTETIINYMACRSAIKFGQKLSIDEMQTLIVQMDKLKRPYTCPHGRPTMISLTLSELEQMFGRK